MVPSVGPSSAINFQPHQNRSLNVAIAQGASVKEIEEMLANPDVASPLNVTRALHLAIQNCRADLTDLFLKHHADPNQSFGGENSALMLAVNLGRPEDVDSSNDEQESDDEQELVNKQKQLEIIRILVQHGALVNHAPDVNEGRTPLHLACDIGDEAAISLLIEFKADVNAPAKDGIRPLHEAATIQSKVACIDLLFKAGAIIDAPNLEGETPLFYACHLESQSFENAVKLIDGGANPNWKDKSGNYPLLIAFKNTASEEIFDLLLPLTESEGLKKTVTTSFEFIKQECTWSDGRDQFLSQADSRLARIFVRQAPEDDSEMISFFCKHSMLRSLKYFEAHILKRLTFDPIKFSIDEMNFWEILNKVGEIQNFIKVFPQKSQDSWLPTVLYSFHSLLFKADSVLRLSSIFSDYAKSLEVKPLAEGKDDRQEKIAQIQRIVSGSELMIPLIYHGAFYESAKRERFFLGKVFSDLSKKIRSEEKKQLSFEELKNQFDDTEVFQCVSTAQLGIPINTREVKVTALNTFANFLGHNFQLTDFYEYRILEGRDLKNRI